MFGGSQEQLGCIWCFHLPPPLPPFTFVFFWDWWMWKLDILLMLHRNYPSSTIVLDHYTHPHFHSHPSSGGTIQISGNMSILGVLLHRMLDGSGIRCTMHRSCTSRVREIIKLPWESFSYVLYDIPTIGSSCRAVPVPLMLHRKWICIILPCNMWAFRTD